jgi:hypothetical protein
MRGDIDTLQHFERTIGLVQVADLDDGRAVCHLGVHLPEVDRHVSDTIGRKKWGIATSKTEDFSRNPPN